MNLSSALAVSGTFLSAVVTASAVDIERRVQHDTRTLRGDSVTETVLEEGPEAVSVELSMGVAFSKGADVSCLPINSSFAD